MAKLKDEEIAGGFSPLLNKHGFKEEVGEVKYDHFIPTGFPKPLCSYKVLWEAFNLPIEETYYGVHSTVSDWGFHQIIKTKDVFAAAEHSSHFGLSQQRLGIQQDKVSQYLAVIGKMVKELFQIVRELRIIDERLDYYYTAQGIRKDEDGKYTKKGKPDHASEVSLKGIWIDMVEQGAKNPASVYGMARELQFTTLPDLFFNAPPMKSDQVDAHVKTLLFNRKVKEVLSRKLKSFLKWKETTFDELKNRRTFTLKFLWQHFDVIKMYMSWVRPYLANIKRMHMDVEKNNTADLVTSFEGSLLEVEFLATQLPVNGDGASQNKKIFACILVNFWYRTRPVTSFYQQDYNKGVAHLGRAVITYRGYAWSKEKIEAYIKYRDNEDFELLKSVSSSVQAAMSALGDEFEKYLTEAGRIEYEKKIQTPKSESKGPDIVSGNPFVAVFKGAGELAKAFIPKKKKTNPPGEISEEQEKKETKAAEGVAKGVTYEVYKIFKKSHGMLAW